jgi:hypothetical protein
MKFSYPVYLKALDIAYPQIIELEKNGIKPALELLSEIEKSKADLSKIDIAYNIRIVFWGLLFFRNDSLISRFKKLGLKPFELRWFVSLDEIDKQFKLIERKGIKIDKPFALTIIRVYLYSKFLVQILSFATDDVTRDEVSKNMLTDYLFKIKKRRQYSEGDPRTYKDWLEMFLNDMINALTMETQGEINIDVFLNISKGKLEKTYLKIIIEECFEYDKQKLNDTEFLCTVYGFFRIILQGYSLADAAYFKSDINGYRQSFDIYRSRRLKTILKLDMSKV